MYKPIQSAINMAYRTTLSSRHQRDRANRQKMHSNVSTSKQTPYEF